ncbi:MAG: hypothetical protein CMM93_02205 [Rickettsiales bacterium]|nr:hypothetical protein [Rickettsiales bacterium]|tara:strand:+ start:2419 stop:3222 length:804 start_codon:yes stop_codon:yes gene_type:complete
MSIETVGQPTKITVHPLPQGQKAQAAQRDTSWGGDGFGFDDFLDIINPLQHIPVVGHIYRAITGDEIATEARIVGGAAFGGVIGLAVAGADAIIETESGATVAEHAVAMVTGETPVKAPVIETAQSAKPQQVASAAPVELPWIKDKVSTTVASAAPVTLPWLQEKVATAPTSLDDVLIQAQMLQAAPKASDVNLQKQLPVKADMPYGAKAVAPKPKPADAITSPADNADVNETIRYLFGQNVEAVMKEYQTSQWLDKVQEVQQDLVA